MHKKRLEDALNAAKAIQSGKKKMFKLALVIDYLI